jgi:hypothetical protein
MNHRGFPAWLSVTAAFLPASSDLSHGDACQWQVLIT